jgi:hypothetical protein
LAGASSGVLSDLVERSAPSQSWDKHDQLVNNISASDYFNIAHRVQNLLKHSKNDPDATLIFDGKETETLMMFATLNLGVLKQ